MVETELKLDLAPGDAIRLAALPPLAGKPTVETLTATYFDTDGEDLRRAGLSLRVRRAGRRRVQTVKADRGSTSGLFVRPEWERDVPDDAPVLDENGPLAPVLRGRPVEARFTTRVKRSLWVIEREDARIEVALDQGEIRAGGRVAPVAELELELLSGPVAALFAPARDLDAAVPLRLGVLSKSGLGFRVADGQDGSAAKGEPVRLDADGGPLQAFAAVAHACLRQFRLNEALLLRRDTRPAPLHQARVGLRRLRSAFTLFKPLLADDPQAARLAAGLKELAATLGEVRDLDVLIERHDGAVGERLALARQAAFATAVARLETSATRRLMLDLVEWLALGDWRTRPADRDTAHEDLRAFAADLLERRRRRVKRGGKHLSRLDDHHRHEVRIEAKKLRYAAEFLSGLWDGKKARRRRDAFLDAIEALQEELGTLNDAATAPPLLARLGLPPAPPLSAPEVHAVVERAEKAYDRMVDVKPFWR